MKKLFLGIMLCLMGIANAQALCTPERNAHGKIKRSSSAIAHFKKLHPCPATGMSTGACKGWTIDHIKPLSCCGMDKPTNMQWQTTAQAKEKDKWELRQCGSTE